MHKAAAEFRVLDAASVDTVMDQGAAKQKAPRISRSQQATGDTEIVKKSWRVTKKAALRLAVTAVMEDKSESAVLDELLLGLNRYSLPGKISRSGKTTAPSGDVELDRQLGEVA